ncbi:MAG: TraB/GumN family protein [Balneolaceae bacterium]|nr:TraB/GumN family protein [Balneolaceae bacterium]
MSGNLFAQSSSLLWKIEADHLDAPSWLFGTMHLICSEDFTVGRSVTDALDQSEMLTLEIDLSDPGVQQQMMQMAIHPENRNITESISREEAELLDRFFTENFGAGIDQFGLMKPFTLISMMMTATVVCEEEQASYEYYLLLRAAERELPMSGLETVDFQMSLFDEIPESIMIDELVKMVSDPEDGIQQFKDMTQDYVNSDIEALYTTILEDDFWHDYKDLLLDARNRAWISQISELASEQPTFFAVGAGHLAGENGVIELLLNEGYTVTPVFDE